MSNKSSFLLLNIFILSILSTTSFACWKAQEDIAPEDFHNYVLINKFAHYYGDSNKWPALSSQDKRKMDKVVKKWTPKLLKQEEISINCAVHPYLMEQLIKKGAFNRATILDFKQNRLESKALARLAKGIYEGTLNPEKIILRDNFIGRSAPDFFNNPQAELGVLAIGIYLAHERFGDAFKLKELDLSQNFIDMQGAYHLRRLFAPKKQVWLKLNFYGNSCNKPIVAKTNSPTQPIHLQTTIVRDPQIDRLVNAATRFVQRDDLSTNEEEEKRTFTTLLENILGKRP